MSLISSEQEREIRLLRHLRNLHLREDFGAWCEFALAPFGQAPARHHRLCIREAQAIADGANDRLILCMPPGSAKSTYLSDLFPAWYMARHPGAQVIGVSHGQDLADDFSRKVQARVRDHSDVLGYGLATEAADRWSTTNRGFYRSAGTGGSITGRRADLLIWDDPLTAKQADSPKERQAAWDFYVREIVGRLKPNARIILILTRWSEDDPAGRMIADMMRGGRQWKVLSLPAIAESHDEMGRKPGDALWPEWEDAAALQQKRRDVGERNWAALFQQRPTAQEGAILKRNWWRTHDAIPERPEMVLMAVDTAYTAKEANDPSGCTIWHLQADGPHRSKLLLRYAWRERLEFNELVRHVLDTASETRFCPADVPLKILVEAKASGLSIVQEMRRLAPELVIQAVVPKGDKVARAHAVTSLLERGRVSAMSQDGAFRPFAQMVIDECAAFPQGAHDDLTDSVTMALRWFRDAGLEFFAEDAPPLDDPMERQPLY